MIFRSKSLFKCDDLLSQGETHTVRPTFGYVLYKNCLLKCDVVQSGTQVLTLLRSLLPSVSELLI